MDNSHKKSSDEVEAETHTIAEANTKSEPEVDSSVEELEFYLCVCRLFDALILMDNSFDDGENNDLKMMTVRLLTF
jgi:hypothetical protein